MLSNNYWRRLIPIPALTYVLTPEVVDKDVIATGYGFTLSLLNEAIQ